MLYPDEYDSFSELLEGLTSLLEKKVLPNSPAVDEAKVSIDEMRNELFRAGLCQIPFSKSYGGIGLPFPVYALAIELAGAAEASTALSIAIHNTVAEGIHKFGNEEQRSELLPDIITGKKLAAFALTEPSSGSDASAMNTKAKKEGSGYALNGSKSYITNAGEADIYLIFARTEVGPSAFLVKKEATGLNFGEDISKLGMKGSRTAEVFLQDCRVGSESLLGEEGMGLEYAKKMLNASRIVMGALCLGIAQLAYDKALVYSKERRAYGRSISELQLIREKISNMITEINSARLLYLYAASLKDTVADFSSEAAQAKILATETSLKVCDDAIQIFSGYGYTNHDVHRHWRDARLLAIGEGTSEVLRMLIARKELAKIQ
jgi:alkylation response protein AidB-like acyl-CoA dehydrogenase